MTWRDVACSIYVPSRAINYTDESAAEKTSEKKIRRYREFKQRWIVPDL